MIASILRPAVRLPYPMTIKTKGNTFISIVCQDQKVNDANGLVELAGSGTIFQGTILIAFMLAFFFSGKASINANFI